MLMWKYLGGKFVEIYLYFKPVFLIGLQIFSCFSCLKLMSYLPYCQVSACLKYYKHIFAWHQTLNIQLETAFVENTCIHPSKIFDFLFLLSLSLFYSSQMNLSLEIKSFLQNSSFLQISFCNIYIITLPFLLFLFSYLILVFFISHVSL